MVLQALLEERFNLKTHWEAKEGDVYLLVVADGGPKLGARGFYAAMPTDERKSFGDRPVPALYQKNDGEGAPTSLHTGARWGSGWKC